VRIFPVPDTEAPRTPDGRGRGGARGEAAAADEEVVRRVVAGDQQALAALYDRCFRPVY